MTPKHECPKCHRSDQLKMTRTQKTVYDMDEDGCRCVADQGDVVFDKITACGCECGYEGDCAEFVKE